MKPDATAPRDARWHSLFLIMILASLATLITAPAVLADHVFSIDQAEIQNNDTLRVGGHTVNRGDIITLRILDATGVQVGATERLQARATNWSFRERPARFRACTAEASDGTTTLTRAIDPPGRPECQVQQQECNIAVTPVTLAFGDVQIGTTGSLSTTVSNSGTADCTVTITQTGSTDFTAAPLAFTVAPGGSQLVNVDYAPLTVGADAGNLAVGSNDPATPNVDVALSGTGVDQQVNNAPTARGDTYATPVGKTLTVTASRLSGVLYNDFDVDGDPITITGNTTTANGTLVFSTADGSFTYTPNASLGDNDNDSFTYTISDGTATATATVNIGILSDQPDFKIMMNYELGMHCTGFEFSYCCVLPPYNSILAQVVKPQTNPNPDSDADFPRLLEGDPREGVDGLGRETVLRDYDDNGGIQKYQLRYFHDAQPRREGQGKVQTSTLISDAEGNSLQYFASIYDSAAVDPVTGALVLGTYNGATNVVMGDGDLLDPTDNYANGWLNHFYIYQDLEGSNPNNSSLEIDKIRLGVTGHVEYPANSGAALQPLGPTGNGAFENVLTFSGDAGTVVFTQSKVLENLPITLTSPRIWEALGLPLTPFEDSIDFFAAPGQVDEDSLRPYVAMKAQLHDYPSGNAVVGSNGHPVIGFGTAPIDIPNCERCHSVPAFDAATGNPNVNSPAYVRRQGGPDPFVWPFGTEDLQALTDLEYDFWVAFYGLVPGVDSDWYPRLKGAAINMLALHDADNGTSFTANYPCIDTTGCMAEGPIPPGLSIEQNYRLGHESVICQRCHADNVIAVVKSADGLNGLIPPITEAVHNTHRNTTELDALGNPGPIVFNDSFGRDGGCQGCHPAHRSDGVLDGYPITLGGDNEQANSDNRLAAGGCFVGRDVHSNPMKDVDGAGTPSHLNAVGQWLVDNVVDEAGTTEWRGIWCTNCHSQLGQEMWRAEDCNSLIHGDCVNNVRDGATLADVAAAVGLTPADAISMLDPKVTNPTDHTHAIWDPANADANVATIEVGAGGPVVTFDADGDPSVNILSFCTTQDCVDRINNNKTDQTQWRYPANAFIDPANTAVAVPFNAATDGRDHWLSAGEPHCADCHAAPYTEQSGNINAFAPFNYPAKASLMRYSRGHQDISCQGCHESIHGLYPVTPTIDTTSYAQAAALNPDGSHGPLVCETCHTVGQNGIPNWIGGGNSAIGSQIANLDDAIGWAHTFTDEASVLDSVCQNCHGDRRDGIQIDEDYLDHAMVGRLSRLMMDKAEIEHTGSVFSDVGSPAGSGGVCQGCHGNERSEVSCGDQEWMQHLTQGRVTHSAWEAVSLDVTGTTCGW